MFGCRTLGVDINPFSALLSRTRVASIIRLDRIESYLSSTNHVVPQVCPCAGVLDPEDIAYAEGVIDRICDGCGLPRDRLWNELLEDELGAYDSEAVTLLSLAVAAKDCALVEKGSNPIWYRAAPRIECSSQKITLRAAAGFWSQIIAKDLLSSKPFDRAAQRIANVNFINISDVPKFDICLTSPPYLNRLDYVIAHLPELSMLRIVTPINFEKLRSDMIGTTKAVMKYDELVPAEWGRPVSADTAANNIPPQLCE
jgi:hypothetical protein